MKVLAVGCSVVLFFAIFISVIGMVWYDIEGKKEGEQATAEGESFGAGTNQRGCLKEAMRRAEGAESVDLFLARHFPDKSPHGLFLAACLPQSKRARNFCDSAPATYDVEKTETWQLGVCDQFGAVEEDLCRELLNVVQEFCEG